MSGPNKVYDPVQVTPLDAEHVEAMVADALAAFDAATTVDELKAARLAHAADRLAIALANREIGALPPQARKDAGARVGRARGTINAALKAREAEIGAAELERRLREERVDVTLPWRAGPRRRRPPDHRADAPHGGRVRRHGLGGRRGPELEAEWLNFDALNFIPDDPARTMQDTLFVQPESSNLVLRTHTSPVQARDDADPRATDLRRLPGQGLPGRRVRRDAHPGVPPDRGPGRRPRHHAGPPAGHARPLRPVDVRRRPGRACDRTTSPSPSRRPRSTCSASSATATRSATRTARARPAAARAGSSGAAAAWSTRGCSRPAASTPSLLGLRLRHGGRADADVPERGGGHARHGRGRRQVLPLARRDGPMMAPALLAA